nr:FHA domain-containing protein [Gemmataceae bacterium]
MAFLSVSYGNEPGRTIPLDGARVVLGRATECDVVLDLPSASRLHACVVREKNAYYLEDLNSRHGTFLNGERLQGRARLRDKDRITIADRDLTFHEGTPQAPPPTDKTAVDAPLVESSRPSPPSKEHSSDLRSAAQIQRALLLGRPTIDLKSQLRADAISIPALAVGGDFYDFFAYDQVLDMVIGDVMGKGVQAALVGAATRLHLLRAINNLLASNPGRLPEPKDILGLVVADVYQHFTDIGTFVTLCYARFDLGERRVQI